MQLEFWFEFASTYSYPAAMRVEALAAQAGVELRWRAFLLGPIFSSQGWNTSPFNIYPDKGRYMWRDLERICERMGLPFQRPPQFPSNGLLAARVACAFGDAPWIGAFVRGVYSASFGQGRDIAQPEVIAAVLEGIGQPSAEVLAQAQTPESKLLLRGQCAQAQSHGIFGAPSMLANGELFWGNDRLEEAFAWLTVETKPAP